MRRVYLYGLGVFALGVAIAAAMIFTAGDKNAEFLKSYGWEIEPRPVEVCDITIPPAFDEVYENYNLLQLEAGLDLSPYCGCEAVRYTYILTNFPYETATPVRANVVTVRGVPVAGDIMTVGIDGFMYSLNFNRAVCFSISS